MFLIITLFHYFYHLFKYFFFTPVILRKLSSVYPSIFSYFIPISTSHFWIFYLFTIIPLFCIFSIHFSSYCHSSAISQEVYLTNFISFVNQFDSQPKSNLILSKKIPGVGLLSVPSPGLTFLDIFLKITKSLLLPLLLWLSFLISILYFVVREYRFLLFVLDWNV